MKVLRRKPRKDKTAVDLRKMTVQDIARFAVKVLRRTKPERVVQGSWILWKDDEEGCGPDPADVIAGKVTSRTCIGCAVGTVLLHDGPKACADFLEDRTKVESWRAGDRALALFYDMSDAFEDRRTPALGLKASIAVAKSYVEDPDEAYSNSRNANSGSY